MGIDSNELEVCNLHESFDTMYLGSRRFELNALVSAGVWRYVLGALHIYNF
jgi:hypothetical protein